MRHSRKITTDKTTMYVCTLCDKSLPVGFFYISRGRVSSWCKKCSSEKACAYEKNNPELINARQRKWRLANREKLRASARRRYRLISESVKKYSGAYQRQNHKIKAAQSRARRAIAIGKLHKRPCETCGEKKIDAHHDDYNKPLEVRWLCHACHLFEHAQKRQKGTVNNPYPQEEIRPKEPT